MISCRYKPAKGLAKMGTYLAINALICSLSFLIRALSRSIFLPMRAIFLGSLAFWALLKSALSLVSLALSF
jgi:hypothetical protein